MDSDYKLLVKFLRDVASSDDVEDLISLDDYTDDEVERLQEIVDIG